MKKKAQIFPMFLFISVIILSLLLYSVLLSPYGKILEDIDYGEGDVLLSKQHKQLTQIEFYTEQVKESIETQISKLSTNPNCFINNKEYWINEFVTQSCDPSQAKQTTSNQNNIQILSNTIEDYLNSSNFENTQFMINTTPIQSGFETKVNVSVRQTKKNYIIEGTKEITFSTSTQQQKQLLEQLQKNLPSLEKNFLSQMANCDPVPVKKCAEEITKKFFLSGIPQTTQTKIDVFEQSNKLEIKVTLMITQSQQKSIYFLFDLSKIPSKPISFQLSQATNAINVKVSRPSSSQYNQLIVLYGTYDFFSSQNPGSGELIKKLAEGGKIPQEFTTQIFPFGIQQKTYIKHSKPTEPFQVTLAGKPIEKSGDTNVLLTQYYNPNTNQYELFSDGQTIYVYVFAVDSHFTYFVDKKALTTQSIQFKKEEFAQPLLHNQVTKSKNENGDVTFTITENNPQITYDFYVCPEQTPDLSTSSKCTIYEHKPSGTYTILQTTQSQTTSDPNTIQISTPNPFFYIVRNEPGKTPVLKKISSTISFTKIEQQGVETYYSVVPSGTSLLPFRLTGI
jgi:hypothetical protein